MRSRESSSAHCLLDPRRQIVQVLTEIPAGAQSGWQMHPGEEVGYILAGTVKVDVKGQPNPILHTGAGFLMPPRPRKRL